MASPFAALLGWRSRIGGSSSLDKSAASNSASKEDISSDWVIDDPPDYAGISSPSSPSSPTHGDATGYPAPSPTGTINRQALSPVTTPSHSPRTHYICYPPFTPSPREGSPPLSGPPTDCIEEDKPSGKGGSAMDGSPRHEATFARLSLPQNRPCVNGTVAVVAIAQAVSPSPPPPGPSTADIQTRTLDPKTCSEPPSPHKAQVCPKYEDPSSTIISALKRAGGTTGIDVALSGQAPRSKKRRLVNQSARRSAKKSEFVYDPIGRCWIPKKYATSPVASASNADLPAPPSLPLTYDNLKLQYELSDRVGELRWMVPPSINVDTTAAASRVLPPEATFASTPVSTMFPDSEQVVWVEGDTSLPSSDHEMELSRLSKGNSNLAEATSDDSKAYEVADDFVVVPAHPSLFSRPHRRN